MSDVKRYGFSLTATAEMLGAGIEVTEWSGDGQPFVLAADYDKLVDELATERARADAAVGDANEAERRVAELAAELQALKAERQWIPFNERMPEGVEDVQLYCADTREQFVGFRARNGLYQFAQDRHGEGIVCRPTHWMPLPAAPQEDKSHE